MTKIKSLIYLSCSAYYSIFIPSAFAQDNTSLQMQLQQRDQVILELLERVESLEQEIGVQPRRMPKDRKEEGDDVTKNEQTAPGQVVVDASMAERALERSLTMAGMLLLSSGTVEYETRLSYARQEDATSSFVDTGMGIVASETEVNSDRATASLLFRFGLPGETQLQISLPYRWRRNEVVTNINFSPVQTSTQSGHAVGDVRISLSKTLLHDAPGQPDIIGQLSWDSSTGESTDNGVTLGGGFDEYGAALSFVKRQDPVVFVGGLSYEFTEKENAIQPGEIYAANFGSYLALNPQTSLSFSFSVAHQNETEVDGLRRKGSDRNIASLNIGGSTLVGQGTLLNVSLGVGLTDDADDFSLNLSLPVRF